MGRRTYEDLARFGAGFLSTNRGLILQRAEQGWFRDLHGDLRGEHICFAPEGIQIFDCAEYSAPLRRRDVASEVACVVMDLESRGAGLLAAQLLTRYRELSPIPCLPELMTFYRCHGALLRAAVNVIVSGTGDAETARYLRYAERVAWKPPRPLVVLVCGATATGKSTVAEELGARLSLAVIGFDSIRSEFAGKGNRTPTASGDGLPERGLTEEVYLEITRRLEAKILAGSGAIVDASFAQRAYREKIARLTARQGIPLLLIHCSAPEELIKLRLAQGPAAPERTWESYLQQKTLCEPLVEVPRGDYLGIDTAVPLEETVEACERFLRSRLAA